MQVIIFETEQGVAVLHPAIAEGMSTEDVAEKDVPHGTLFIIIDSQELPDSEQKTWRLDMDNRRVIVDPQRLKAAKIEALDNEKGKLRTEALDKISLLRTELELGLITEDDKQLLAKWLSYIKQVEETDITPHQDVVFPPLPD